MNTNNNQGNSKKEIGKIEGVIYLTGTPDRQTSARPEEANLPFPEAGLPPQTQGKPMYHKERTQDILVHCPVSLHKRLTNLKSNRWEELGERLTINNMIVEAIADWLERQKA